MVYNEFRKSLNHFYLYIKMIYNLLKINLSKNQVKTHPYYSDDNHCLAFA